MSPPEPEKNKDMNAVKFIQNAWQKIDQQKTGLNWPHFK